MRRDIKKVCAKALAVVMAASMLTSTATDAKKTVKLSKSKVELKKGASTKITAKNGKVKKWAIKSGGKSIISITKKTKTYVKIKAKKVGKTTLTATFTNKKKKNVSVKVIDNSIKNNTQVTNAPGVKATNQPTAEPTVAPTPTPINPDYSFDDAYTLGYNGGIKQYNKDAGKSISIEKSKVYNMKTDNVFAVGLLNETWDKEVLTLTQPLKFTVGKGEIHDVDSTVTDYNLWADPTCIDNSNNDGKLYVYGTTEGVEYDKDGKLQTNGYNNHSLTIASSADMVNWTDEGFLDNANLTNEISTSTQKVKAGWAEKAWAPSGLKIDGDGDGKDEYYVFYTNGGAVGYVMGESPVGPWKSFLKRPLFTQSTPNCSGVVWCFDPAVLADDKGNAYVYFGGGVPGGDTPTDEQKRMPNTGRVCKIKFKEGTGEVELDGKPQVLNNYYMFEDSEINQINGKYIYSYCSNFKVPAKDTFAKSGTICAYVSSDPMNISFDPEGHQRGVSFTEDGVYHNYLGTILDNPSTLYGESYNNHHHMQSFKGRDYIFYHSTVLGNSLYRYPKQYRNLHVDEISIDKETDAIKIDPSFEGAKQIESFNPYKNVDGSAKIINATTHAKSAGINSKRDDYQVANGKNGSPMVIDNINTGDWTMIRGADFGEKGLKKFAMEYASNTDNARVEVYVDSPILGANRIATVDINGQTNGEYKTTEVTAYGDVKGKHDVYFVFRGENFNIASWMFSE